MRSDYQNDHYPDESGGEKMGGSGCPCGCLVVILTAIGLFIWLTSRVVENL